MRRWLDLQRAHDSELHEHSLRVGGIIAAFTCFLGYSQQAQAMSLEAGVLHDVGKIRISPQTLRKRGPLSPQEIQVMRCHPDIGVILLSGANLPVLDVLKAIQQHHERLDGTGYPQGISGRSVCQLARVLSICDVFAALTESRVYQGAHTQQEAVEVLLRNRGGLDIQLVESFARMAEKASVDVPPAGDKSTGCNHRRRLKARSDNAPYAERAWAGFEHCESPTE